MTQKPSGIGSRNAYVFQNKAYVMPATIPNVILHTTVWDISNIPNASSLLLVCAGITIAVGLLWFYLKPGAVQAHSRHGIFPGTYQTSSTFTMPGTSQTVHDCKPCTIGRQSHTFSFPAPFVILSDITHALQTATVCMVTHVSSPCTMSDYDVYHTRCALQTVCAIMTCRAYIHLNLIVAI
jgi:hypothetical protein